MNKLLRVLLNAGLALLESDTVTATRRRVADQIDNLGERTRETYEAAADRVGRASRSIRGEEDHTLTNTVAFLVGVGAGVGVGLLFAPASGEETRGTITGRVQELGEKVRGKLSPEDNPGTGTYGH